MRNFKDILESVIKINEASELQDFVKDVNKLRLQNKNKWYSYKGNVQNKNIRLKGFGTWLQVFDVDGTDYSGPMEISIKDFKEVFQKPF